MKAKFVNEALKDVLKPPSPSKEDIKSFYSKSDDFINKVKDLMYDKDIINDSIKSFKHLEKNPPAVFDKDRGLKLQNKLNQINNELKKLKEVNKVLFFKTLYKFKFVDRY